MLKVVPSKLKPTWQAELMSSRLCCSLRKLRPTGCIADAGKFLRGTADTTGRLVTLQPAQIITNAIMASANLLVGITLKIPKSKFQDPNKNSFLFSTWGSWFLIFDS